MAKTVSQEQSGNYGFLLGIQGTSHIKPRGPLGSSPLRSDGSRNGQAGKAGPVEHCSAEATLTTTYLKKQVMGKSSWSGKSFEFTRKRERRLLYAPILNLQWGDDVVIDVDVDE